MLILVTYVCIFFYRLLRIFRIFTALICLIEYKVISKEALIRTLSIQMKKENIRRKRRRLGIDTDDQHDSTAINQFMSPDNLVLSTGLIM